MREVEKEEEIDQNNIVIMGFDPNGNKSTTGNTNGTTDISKTNKIPRGWCYQGVHCNNKYCQFKHRDLPADEEYEEGKTWLPSEIRGPRLHSRASDAYTKKSPW